MTEIIDELLNIRWWVALVIWVGVSFFLVGFRVFMVYYNEWKESKR